MIKKKYCMWIYVIHMCKFQMFRKITKSFRVGKSCHYLGMVIKFYQLILLIQAAWILLHAFGIHIQNFLSHLSYLLTLFFLLLCVYIYHLPKIHVSSSSVYSSQCLESVVLVRHAGSRHYLTSKKQASTRSFQRKSGNPVLNPAS